MGPWSDGTGAPIRRVSREFAFPPPPPSQYVPRRGHVKRQQEDIHLQTRKRALMRT